MGKKFSEQERRQFFEEVRQMIALEYEVDPEQVTEKTDVIKDLGGDSIIFFEIIEQLKNKYGFDVEIRLIALHFNQYPSETLGEVVDGIIHVVEHT